MVKRLLAAVLIISMLLFSNRRKDGSSTNHYYITMKIDNKDFSFSDSLFAIKQPGPPKLIIFGFSKTQGQTEWYFSDTSIGTYIDSYDTTIKQVIYQFTINAFIGQSYATLIRPDPTIVSNPISMTITNVNNI